MYNSGQFSNKETIKNILSSHGYKFRDMGEYLTCQAVFRGGSDEGSVAIYPNKFAKDFVTATVYPIPEFLQLVTQQKSEEELKSYFEKNNIVIQEVDNSPKITQRKKYPKELLLHISDDYSYANSRGISNETCKLFQCGAVTGAKGVQNNRFVFPIFNQKDEVVGFSGRTLNNNPRKYIVNGDKKLFVWPAFINDKIIDKCKCVILTESNFDILWMFENGIKNVLCLFGTELNLGILNYLLRRNIEKIIISTNNEESGVGNEAALKIKKKLNKYFDNKNSIIKLPYKKDFCDMTKPELQKWMDEIKIQIGYGYFNYE